MDSSSLRRSEANGARHLHELAEPPRFGLRDCGPMRRDPVVPPPLVVVFRRRPVPGFDDEPLLQHALDGAIERAGAELQLAAGPGKDILNDRVAMAVFLG